MIVYAGIISHILSLSQATKYPIYHHKYEHKERDFTKFFSGTSSVIIGSGNIGTRLDIDNIHSIVYLDGLFGLIDFAQESGRTGRKIEPTLSTYFVNPFELAKLNDGNSYKSQSTDAIKMEEKRALQKYITTKGYRRLILNQWFDLQANLPYGDRAVEPYDNCRGANKAPFQSSVFQPPASVTQPVKDTAMFYKLSIVPFSHDLSWEAFLHFLLTMLVSIDGCPICFLYHGTATNHHLFASCSKSVTLS